MDINIDENDKEFIIKIGNYTYSVFKDNVLTKDMILNIVINNQIAIINMLQNKEIDNIRQQRLQEFALFDKYQLNLLWNSLTSQQQQEYITWRAAWLNSTTTNTSPKRLDWFKME